MFRKLIIVCIALAALVAACAPSQEPGSAAGSPFVATAPSTSAVAPTSTAIPPTPTTAPVVKLDEAMLKNASYELLDLGKMQLVEGKYEKKQGEGSTQRFTVGYMQSAFGDLNGNGVEDAVVTLWANTGGSGVFEYLIAMINENGAPKQIGIDFLGDRVKIEKLVVEGQQIIVSMLSQGPNDPSCCPTQKALRVYAVRNGSLVLLSETVSATTGLKGAVTYRERIALPPTAVIKVQLVDVSRADAPAIVLGEQTIATTGRQVPFQFEIRYDPAAIKSSGVYAIQATISDNDQVLFRTTQVYRVLTGNAPAAIEIVLTKMGASESGSPDSVENTTWVLEAYGPTGQTQAALAGQEVNLTLSAADGRISGKAGCNSYTGGYKLDGDKLTLPTPMASTMMACAEDVMKQEQAFLKLLQTAESYALSSGKLQINCAGGQVLILRAQ